MNLIHFNGKGGLKGIIDDIVVKRQLVSFKKRYKTIYIYGCGFWGNHISYVLENWCIEFEGFCQSEKQYEIYNGYSVCEFNEEIAINKHVGFIMAMDKDKTSEVLKRMKQYGCENRTFMKIKS